MKISMKHNTALSLGNFRLFIILYWALQHIRLLQITRFKFITYLVVAWAILLFLQHSGGILQNVKKNYLMLVLFLISYIFTSFLNYKYALEDNIQLVIWEFIQFFLLTYYSGDIRENRKEIRKIIRLFVIYTAIFSFLSLLMYWLNINGIAQEITTGDSFRYGYRNGRLFGMYGSPNYGALFSVISILLSIGLMEGRSRQWKYKINIFIQMYYLILSDSRTGIVVFLVAATLMLTWIKCQKMHIISKKGWFSAFIFYSFISIIIVTSFKPIKELSTDYLNQLIVEKRNHISIEMLVNTNSTKKLDSSQIQYAAPEVAKVNRDDRINENISNERFDIWKNALSSFYFSKPIFGVTQLGYMEYGQERFPSSFIITKNKFSLHNDFITALTCSGIVGFSFLFLFFIVTGNNIVKAVKSLFYKKELEIIECTIFIMLVVCVSTMLFSDAIILNLTTESLLFWTSMGYMLSFLKLNRKGKNS